MLVKKKTQHNKRRTLIPIGSMYGIFTYIWLIFMVNVGEYAIHGSYGIGLNKKNMNQRPRGVVAVLDRQTTTPPPPLSSKECWISTWWKWKWNVYGTKNQAGHEINGCHSYWDDLSNNRGSETIMAGVKFEGMLMKSCFYILRCSMNLHAPSGEDSLTLTNSRDAAFVFVFFGA